ncbi:hypothetical protein RJT34_29956 [Clitoria ternatea]|uniref:Uncharacterized protein n=1 Tax=Clitoria ternatea TaxID=43366 RepID=A0AAN9ESJ8_CLITE
MKVKKRRGVACGFKRRTFIREANEPRGGIQIWKIVLDSTRSVLTSQLLILSTSYPSMPLQCATSRGPYISRGTPSHSHLHFVHLSTSQNNIFSPTLSLSLSLPLLLALRFAISLPVKCFFHGKFFLNRIGTEKKKNLIELKSFETNV